MKDHGPDFEIEMPTKQKAKHTTGKKIQVGSKIVVCFTYYCSLHSRPISI